MFGDNGKIALMLGEKEEAEKFAMRRKNLNELIHQKFYHPGKGIYSTGSQLDMCYPMLVGAVPDSLYDDVKRKMMTDTEKQRQRSYCCRVGRCPNFDRVGYS